MNAEMLTCVLSKRRHFVLIIIGHIDYNSFLTSTLPCTGILHFELQMPQMFL